MSRKKFLRPKKKHKTAWAVKSQRKQEKKEAARAEKVLKLIVYYWKNLWLSSSCFCFAVIWLKTVFVDAMIDMGVHAATVRASHVRLWAVESSGVSFSDSRL